MTGPTFHVSGVPGGDLEATTDLPELRGVRWWWTPGTGAVEYGLSGDHPVGLANVWDYARGACGIDPTPEALATYLTERYSDPEAVAALVDELANS